MKTNGENGTTDNESNDTKTETETKTEDSKPSSTLQSKTEPPTNSPTQSHPTASLLQLAEAQNGLDNKSNLISERKNI